MISACSSVIRCEPMNFFEDFGGRKKSGQILTQIRAPRLAAFQHLLPPHTEMDLLNAATPAFDAAEIADFVDMGVMTEKKKLSCRKDEDIEQMSMSEFKESCCKKVEAQVESTCTNGVGFVEMTCGKYMKHVDQCM